MVNINEFDNIMKQVINRQLEFTPNRSVKEMVSVILKQLKNKNFQGITKKCIPFFKSINIVETMEKLMGCDFDSAVYLYSKRMDSFYKSNQNKSVNNITANRTYNSDQMVINDVINSMEEAKTLVDTLYQGVGYNNLINILKRSYKVNTSLQKYIEEGHTYVFRKGGISLDTSLDNKINNFISYVRNYYKLTLEDEHNSHIKTTAKEIDGINTLNLNYNQKIGILTDLYYGKSNPFSDLISEKISKEDVMISLIRNAIQVSLVSTNMEDRTNQEFKLYENVSREDEMQILIYVRGLIDKLVCGNSNVFVSKISTSELKSNLNNNLNYQDIKYLSWLYIYMRRSPESIRILESAKDTRYKIVNRNKNQFSNSSYLLDCIESKEFYDYLKQTYHM